MNRNIHIDNELRSLSDNVAAIPFEQTFSVPDQYFDGLEQSIFACIRLEEQEKMTASDEISNLSPLLAGIIHKSTYTVDPGFFEQNDERLQEITNKKPTHIVRMPIRKIVIKMAVAATFIGFIGLVIFWTLFTKKEEDIVSRGLKIKTEEQFNQYLDKLENEDIIVYLSHHSLPSDHDAIGSFIDGAGLPDEEDYFDETVLDALIITN
jgi:hypothetical protein